MCWGTGYRLSWNIALFWVHDLLARILNGMRGRTRPGDRSIVVYDGILLTVVPRSILVENRGDAWRGTMNSSISCFP